MSAQSKGGVVVTGGARGIGLAIAESCARNGYGVVIADLEGLEQDFTISAAENGNVLQTAGRLEGRQMYAAVRPPTSEGPDHIRVELYDFQLCELDGITCEPFEGQGFLEVRGPRLDVVPDGSFGDGTDPDTGLPVCGFNRNGNDVTNTPGPGDSG